jgi:hypothetical protein
MPFKDILKRQVDNLLSTERDRAHVSLGDDLRSEFDRQVSNAIDPDREAREAAQRQAEIDRAKAQPGLGQQIEILGMPGQWDAVELTYIDETSAAFALVDRLTGDGGQLAAVDDGTVVLDWPGGQHGANVLGAFWTSGTEVGIRLSGAVLTSIGESPITVNCDLRAPAPEPEIDDYSAGA